MAVEFTFTGTLWVHDGPAAWFFLTLPVDLAEEIQELVEGQGRPFGSVKVDATIGSARWSTSIFRDRARESYLLPVKAAVRKQAGIDAGDEVECSLALDL